MNEIKIRRATLSDLKTIQSLNNDLINYEMDLGLDTYIKNWSLGETAAEYFKELIENQFVAVAEVRVGV